jgi:hypothetical protein
LIGESTSPSRADDAFDTCTADKDFMLRPQERPVVSPASRTAFRSYFDDENTFQNMDLCLESSLAGQLVEGVLPAISVEG